MTGYLVAALVVIGLVAVYLLLARITARGGTSHQDPSAVTDQVLAETDAFRGSRSANDPKWDGQNRLAEPTSEGWPLWPVAPRRHDDQDADPS